MVDQIELHPGLNQNELLEYCKVNDIVVEASSPLGNGQILNNENLQMIAENKKKTVAQVCLRWGLQKGSILIPKTTNVGRMQENFDIFNFSLDKKEMDAIDKISYCGGIGIDSDEVEEFG